MIKLIFALLVSAVLVLPASAGRNHEGGHDHHDGYDLLGKKHQHGDEKGPVGSPAQLSSVQQNITVSLTDEMRINFKEELSKIKSGTIIQFIVTNEGKIPHEFSIGNQEEQKEHAEMMRKMPDMVHSDGNTVTVAPGTTEFLIWHFEGDDVIVFSCNIPGHYEAGMFRKVALSQ